MKMRLIALAGAALLASFTAQATEGLAPLVRAEIWRVLETLKRDGLAILLIDKNVAALLRVADRHVIIERGRAVWTGTSAELSTDDAARERFLGV